jgi:hypothetical protein
MPKRTNPFQQVIYRVNDILKGADVIVDESVLLIENIDGEKIEREIDILIQRNVNGRTYKIAIECRDRGDKDSIEWVDGLIGKYSDLEVDEIIAVSNSGFSKAAYQKAKHHNIQLVALEEVDKADFGKHVLMGGADVKLTFGLAMLEVESTPALQNVTLDLDEEVFDSKGTKLTLRGLVNGLLAVQPGLFHELKEKVTSGFETAEDLTKEVLLPKDHIINGLYTLKHGDVLGRIDKIKIVFYCKPEVKEVNLKNKKYKDALISGYKSADDNFVDTIYLMQINGQGQVFFERKKRKKKSGKLDVG